MTRSSPAHHSNLMRRLIVNADDLGLSDSVNLGVLKAAQEGIVTSTSLMANGPEFSGAVERLLANPALDVGIHLTLVECRPLSPAHKLRRLLDRQDRLPRTCHALIGRLAAHRAVVKEVEYECRAQIERVLSAGLQPSHLDSHHHVHFFPPLWRLVGRLAREYGIPAIRGFRGAWHPARIARPSWRDLAYRWPLVAAACAVDWWNGRGQLYQTVATVGLVESGHLTESVLATLLSRVPPGVTELVCHPADRSDGATLAGRVRGYQRSDELAALKSAAIRQLLQHRQIVLTTFRELTTKTMQSFGPVGGVGRLDASRGVVLRAAMPVQRTAVVRKNASRC